MKEFLIIYGLSLVAGVSAAVVAAGGRGPKDVQEIAAGIAVFAGLSAVTTPVLRLLNEKK